VKAAFFVPLFFYEFCQNDSWYSVTVSESAQLVAIITFFLRIISYTDYIRKTLSCAAFPGFVWKKILCLGVLPFFKQGLN
jgi:hypothetical protein